MLRPRTLAALSARAKEGLRVIVVTGRMVQSVRRVLEPAGLREPMICYQGAVVADADGRWLLHVPIELELAREAIAAVEAEGYEPNVYVDDELYVSRVTPNAERYSSFQHIPLHPVGDLRTWLERAADQARLRRRPGCARRARRAHARALRRQALGDEVAAVLPRVRERRRLEGLGPRLPVRAARLLARADGRVRRRRERRRARRVGRVRRRGRERVRPCEGGRRLDLPAGVRGGGWLR